MNSEILEKQGLSPMEWDALEGAADDYFRSIDALALYIVDDRRGYGLQSTITCVDTCKEVLCGLIKRGWLTVVSEPPEIRAARFANRGIQTSPPDRLAGIGCVDFTCQGYRKYRQALKDEGIRWPETLVWADEEALTLSCIAGTKRACQNWLGELKGPHQGGILDWFPHPVRQGSIYGPERVGAWKSPETGRTHPSGWRTTVSVKRVRRKRLFLPGWQAEGWITPEERVSIKGEIEGIRFWFFDAVEIGSWEDRTLVYQAYLTIRDGKSKPKEPADIALNCVGNCPCNLRAYKSPHFEWEEAKNPKRTKTLTLSEALICLHEGFSGWKSTHANTPEA